MTVPIKISTPSIEVQGISLVQGSNEVLAHYRKANGDLESVPVLKFYDDGVGVAVFLYNLPVGTVFSVDANSRVKIAP